MVLGICQQGRADGSNNGVKEFRQSGQSKGPDFGPQVIGGCMPYVHYGGIQGKRSLKTDILGGEAQKSDRR